MKKLARFGLLPLLSLLVLASCGEPSSLSSSSSSLSGGSSLEEPSSSDPSSSESSSIEESSSASSSESESSSEESSSGSSSAGPMSQQTYSHVFKQGDFVSSGGTTAKINGLSWTYGAFAFLGAADKGIQIGSKNNPQTSLWTMTASFSEAIEINSYELQCLNAAAGSATYTVSFGEHKKEEVFSSTSTLAFKEEALTERASSISLSFIASAKAIYFYSFGFSAMVPDSSTLSLSGDVIVGTPVEPGVNGIPEVNYQDTTIETYYSGVDYGGSGSALRTALHTKISTMTAVNYGSAKTMLQYTDENPEEKGFMYGLYDGDKILCQWDSGSSWNREHVWACAQMKIDGNDPRPGDSDKGIGTDLFNLRAACPSANGKHGDKFYDEVDSSSAIFPNYAEGSFTSGSHLYRGDHRGDVARTLFYMYSRYDGLKLNDELDGSDVVSMGKLSCLLSWDQLDPVDAFETSRNNRIYNYQGNRNPFVDLYAKAGDGEQSLAQRLFA